MQMEVDNDLAEMIKRVQEQRKTDRNLDKAIKEKQEETFFDWLKRKCSDIWNSIVKVVDGIGEFCRNIWDFVKGIFS